VFVQPSCSAITTIIIVYYAETEEQNQKSKSRTKSKIIPHKLHIYLQYTHATALHRNTASI